MIMAKILMMMMMMTVAEPSLSGSLVQIVWKNEEGAAHLWGDKFVHREFLASIPSTYWRGVGVMGDVLSTLYSFTTSLSPSSLSCFFFHLLKLFWWQLRSLVPIRAAGHGKLVFGRDALSLKTFLDCFFFQNLMSICE